MLLIGRHLILITIWPERLTKRSKILTRTTWCQCKVKIVTLSLVRRLNLTTILGGHRLMIQSSPKFGHLKKEILDRILPWTTSQLKKSKVKHSSKILQDRKSVKNGRRRLIRRMNSFSSFRLRPRLSMSKNSRSKEKSRMNCSRCEIYHPSRVFWRCRVNQVLTKTWVVSWKSFLSRELYSFFKKSWLLLYLRVTNAFENAEPAPHYDCVDERDGC